MATPIELATEWPLREASEPSDEAHLGSPIIRSGVTYRLDLGWATEIVLHAPDGTVRARPAWSIDDEQDPHYPHARSVIAALVRAVDVQRTRLLAAITGQQTWERTTLRRYLAERPVTAILARRLIWALGDGRTTTLTQGLDFVDVHHNRIDPVGQVRIAHPRVDDLKPWQPWLAELEAFQPFKQIEREVYDVNLLDYLGRVVWPHSLYDLPNRGWRWPSNEARQSLFVRRLSNGQDLALSFSPGMTTKIAPAMQSDQTLVGLQIDGEAKLQDLSTVAQSEIARDLEKLQIVVRRSRLEPRRYKRGATFALVDGSRQLELSDEFAQLTFHEGLWYHLNDLLDLLFDEYEEEEVLVESAPIVAAEMRAMLDAAGMISVELRAEILTAVAFIEDAAKAGKSVWVIL